MQRGEKVLVVAGAISMAFIALMVASYASVAAVPSEYAGLTEKQRNLIQNVYEVCQDDVEMGNIHAHDCEKEKATSIQHYLDVNKRNANS